MFSSFYLLINLHVYTLLQVWYHFVYQWRGAFSIELRGVKLEVKIWENNTKPKQTFALLKELLLLSDCVIHDEDRHALTDLVLSILPLVKLTHCKVRSGTLLPIGPVAKLHDKSQIPDSH